MQITTRDKALLRLLNRHNLLSTKQIQRRVFAELELTTVMRRLRKLHAAGFVVRLGMLHCRTLVWGCSQLSHELFAGFTSSQRTNLHTLDHDTRLSDVRFFFEDLTRVDDWFDLRHLKHDAMPAPFDRDYARHRYDFADGDAALVPDALFVGYKNDEPFSCSIELELSMKANSRYRKLMQAYSYRKHPELILYVVENDSIRNSIMNCAHYNIRPECKILTVRLQDLMSAKDNAVLQNAKDKTLIRMHEVFDCKARRSVHPAVQPVDKLVITGGFGFKVPEPSDW